MAQTPAELQPLHPGVSPVEDDSKVRLGRDYLRLLAAEARFDCSSISRHPDGFGVDVRSRCGSGWMRKHA